MTVTREERKGIPLSGHRYNVGQTASTFHILVGGGERKSTSLSMQKNNVGTAMTHRSILGQAPTLFECHVGGGGKAPLFLETEVILIKPLPLSGFSWGQKGTHCPSTKIMLFNLLPLSNLSRMGKKAPLCLATEITLVNVFSFPSTRGGRKGTSFSIHQNNVRQSPSLFHLPFPSISWKAER